VELLESEKGMFFESGSPDPTDTGRELIERLAEQLRGLPNDLLIEGHTDSRPFKSRPDYSNWELSSDRANAARRILESSGLRAGQIIQVRGFADNDPRDKDHPEAASNRRVSVIVRYQNVADDADKDDDPEPPSAPKPGGRGK
jgi:chemotaxis protein MotB